VWSLAIFRGNSLFSGTNREIDLFWRAGHCPNWPQRPRNSWIFWEFPIGGTGNLKVRNREYETQEQRIWFALRDAASAALDLPRLLPTDRKDQLEITALDRETSGTKLLLRYAPGYSNSG
jgi:hypothetical protein